MLRSGHARARPPHHPGPPLTHPRPHKNPRPVETLAHSALLHSPPLPFPTVPFPQSGKSLALATMSSTGSHSNGCSGEEEELALRIALERSRVNTGGSSGSAPTPPVTRHASADAGAGPSRPARGSARPARSAPPARRPPPPSAAAPHGQRWVLVPAQPTPRMQTPESEARVARRERQRAWEMADGSDGSV
jgi:hypothetical protein